MIGYLMLTAGIVLLDVTIKWWVDKHEKLGAERPILNGRVILTKYYNKGAAFRLLEKYQKTLMAINMGVLGFAAGIQAVLLREEGKHMQKIALAMMLGGGAGNLFDRLRKKHVVDYFRFPVKCERLGKIVFNLSDLFIFLGGLLTILSGIKESE